MDAMGKDKYHKLPSRDPVTGGDLYVSELTSEDGSIVIRGKFELPLYSRLDAEQSKLLETFLRCRGMLNSVERELGISYPTVRARLDGLLEALGMAPVKEEKRQDKIAEKKRKILDLLEKGEISAEEAKEKLGALK